MTRGGKRTGAGRKPGKPGTNKKIISIRIKPELYEWLKRQPEGISPKIERLIRNDMII